jgi:hypothetical protein
MGMKEDYDDWLHEEMRRNHDRIMFALGLTTVLIITGVLIVFASVIGRIL